MRVAEKHFRLQQTQTIFTTLMLQKYKFPTIMRMFATIKVYKISTK